MMTSSNHVLLLSDEDNRRTRKTSTSSSLDSWEGLGLDEICEPKASSSKYRPQVNQNVRVLPKYDPHSSSITSSECPRNVLVPRNVQTNTNLPRNVQKHYDEMDVSNARLDQMIWYTGGSSAPEESRIFKASVQNSNSPRVYVPASHLFKAERVNRGIGNLPPGQQRNFPRTSGDSPTSCLQKHSQLTQQQQQGSPVDQTEKIKVKLKSVWHNMKYGWSVRTKTAFSSSPISLLGVTYEDQHYGDLPPRIRGESSYKKFLLDFSTRIWLTYRLDFPMLEDSTLTSDCGWGCMLRSGQMMLAQALMTHLLGRSWRVNEYKQNERTKKLYPMILRWFGDVPCPDCPFSLHYLVRLGRGMGKKAGDWYGPASVAYILKQAMEAAALEHPSLDDLCVYVAQDCTVYKKDVIELCTQPSRVQRFQDCNVIRNSPLPPPHRIKLPVALNHPSEAIIDWREALEENYTAANHSGTRNVFQYVPRGLHSPPMSPLSRTSSIPHLATSELSSSPLPSMGQSSFPSGMSSDCADEPRGRWRSLVVLVPVRLGGDRLNKIYFPCIYKLLAHKCSIGIIGGRPRHSLYFVGFQDDKLINLDPHYCQETVDMSAMDFPFDSFQCTDPRKTPISKMDPSCTIGFYFRTREDFESFTETAEPILSSGDGKSDYPVFIVSSESSSMHVENLTELDLNSHVEEPSLKSYSDLEGDDFVLI